MGAGTPTPGSLEEGLLPPRAAEDHEGAPLLGKADDAPGGECSELGARTMRKVSLRILPLLFVFSLLSMVCKTNVSYASAGMMRDLQLTDEEFGSANSMFVLAYMVATIPAVLFTKKIGASRALPLMMLGFGAATLYTAFCRSFFSLVLSRLVLGVTEAGVLQSCYYYLSIFYPPKRYAFAASVSVGLGLSMSDAGGGLFTALIFYCTRSSALLHGWQWLFVVEAAPCLVFALVTYLVLPSRPDSCARFLAADEAAWLVRATNASQDEKRRRSLNLSRRRGLGAPGEGGRPPILLRLLSDPRVALKAANVFFWGIGLWCVCRFPRAAAPGRRGPDIVHARRRIAR